jgi:hypothetical protein
VLTLAPTMVDHARPTLSVDEMAALIEAGYANRMF